MRNALSAMTMGPICLNPSNTRTTHAITTRTAMISPTQNPTTSRPFCNLPTRGPGDEGGGEDATKAVVEAAAVEDGVVEEIVIRNEHVDSRRSAGLLLLSSCACG